MSAEDARCLRTCGVAGCTEPATWQPILVMHLLPCGAGCRHDPEETQAVTDPTWSMCDGHKQSCKVENLMNPVRWSALTALLVEHGVHPPDQSRSDLAFQPLVAGEA